MIHGHTLNGTKDLTLRGWKGPRGLKGIVTGSILTAGGDKIFWDGSSPPTPTILASAIYVTGAAAVPGSASITTSASTVSISGGSPPYSFAWTLTTDDGAGGIWQALSPTSASSQFRASAVPALNDSTAVFTCTVTDARGAVATVTVTANAQNYGH